MKRGVSRFIKPLLIIAALTSSAFATSQVLNPNVTDIHTATVKEAQTAGNYVYLLVVEGNEEYWLAASPGLIADVKSGDVVEFRVDVVMRNFTSKTLRRTFESIRFVAQIRFKQDDSI